LGLLQAASEREPDLGTYYKYHCTLFEMLAQAKAGISAKAEMVDDTAIQARLLEGLPLLSFAQVPLEAGRFAELVSDVAGLLVESNPDLEGQTVPARPDECLDLARQRFGMGQSVNGQVDTGPGEIEGEASLAQMSVDLALKPYLEWAAERVLPRVEVDRWKRRYCPACGGAPDFGSLEEDSGTRYLLCSRCSSQWPYRRVGCPFCGTVDHTELSYYLSEDEVYRLYVCQACHRYLKVLDLRKASHQVPFPVERVTTVGMDVAARQQGYR
jgi:FdhE protein